MVSIFRQRNRRNFFERASGIPWEHTLRIGLLSQALSNRPPTGLTKTEPKIEEAPEEQRTLPEPAKELAPGTEDIIDVDKEIKKPIIDAWSEYSSEFYRDIPYGVEEERFTVVKIDGDGNTSNFLYNKKKPGDLKRMFGDEAGDRIRSSLTYDKPSSLTRVRKLDIAGNTYLIAGYKSEGAISKYIKNDNMINGRIYQRKRQEFAEVMRRTIEDRLHRYYPKEVAEEMIKGYDKYLIPDKRK